MVPPVLNSRRTVSLGSGNPGGWVGHPYNGHDLIFQKFKILQRHVFVCNILVRKKYKFFFFKKLEVLYGKRRLFGSPQVHD